MYQSVQVRMVQADKRIVNLEEGVGNDAVCHRICFLNYVHSEYLTMEALNK
jgi:hypothetical protein